MKIKLQRMSGRPVDPVKASQWETERRAYYDSAICKHANVPQGTELEKISWSSVDMDAVQKDLAAFDVDLNSRYAMFDTVELPKNIKGWRSFADKYQAPVMIAQSSEGKNEFVLVLMDEAFG